MVDADALHIVLAFEPVFTSSSFVIDLSVADAADFWSDQLLLLPTNLTKASTIMMTLQDTIDLLIRLPD